MRKSVGIAALLAFAASLAACGGGGYGGGGYTAPAPGGGGGPSGVGAMTVGLALPSSAIGIENDPSWGTVGGYTQNIYSQVLAFAPGSTITIRNLGTTAHTLNVIGTRNGPPANFPANPNLDASANGNSLDANFRSGALNPGATMQIKLNTPGIYLIGCAFHYTQGMRDVIIVSSSAAPGPQATPQPSGGGGGSGCGGSYC